MWWSHEAASRSGGIATPSRQAVAAAALAFGLVAAPVAGIGDEADLSGKTVTIVVGFDPGGGYDTWARVVADHIARHLPGEPNVIVENMPGAGGNRATIYMAMQAPKDGTVISLLPQPFVLEGLVGRLGAEVAPNNFGFIGRLTTHTATLITWSTSPIRTVDDARTRETTIATPGIDVTNVVARIMNERSGTRFRLVDGYKGTAEMALAMEREEVEGMSFSFESLEAIRGEWLESGQVNVVWQVASERHARLPDVPTVLEFDVSDDVRALLGLLASIGDVGRSLATPPGVPDEMVAAYRTAFDALMADPDFRADVERRGLTLDAADGETVEGYVATAMDSPANAVATLIDLFRPGG